LDQSVDKCAHFASSAYTSIQHSKVPAPMFWWISIQLWQKFAAAVQQCRELTWKIHLCCSMEHIHHTSSSFWCCPLQSHSWRDSPCLQGKPQCSTRTGSWFIYQLRLMLFSCSSTWVGRLNLFLFEPGPSGQNIVAQARSLLVGPRLIC